MPANSQNQASDDRRFLINVCHDHGHRLVRGDDGSWLCRAGHAPRVFETLEVVPAPSQALTDLYREVLTERDRLAGEVERLRGVAHQAHEFAGNVIRYATGPVKPELWEDDSPLIEQAWSIVKAARSPESDDQSLSDKETRT